MRANAAAPSIQEALSDPAPRVRQAAGRAIRKIRKIAQDDSAQRGASEPCLKCPLDTCCHTPRVRVT